ncbi:SMC-Scp complex subunit ScpB [Micromonospora sp. WMMD882]|uniref:SMC-Scp complex subunit ScpB n=1 Tax=Micromonospora sp. WMMD882 TaxID=3015151 RepID=UPI00248B1138|nr:SMC-Scp complex subunit ScpB [Micromonospora sp. WMMD882]WBB81298.1 SMC-Scp complex subunit ScpB [Micromonospora sp. WMMD882]
MSHEERAHSLADQAAAWVPPWERRPAPAPSDADQPTSPPVPVDADQPGPASVPADAGQPDAASVPAGADRPDPAPVRAEADQPTPVDADRPAPAPPRGRRRVARAEPEPVPPMDDAELRGALEAILLVVDEPVSETTLAQVLDQPATRVGGTLERIAADYTAAGHGFELRRAAGGWRLYTRPEHAPYVERFILDGQSVRLTQAALETLAVVAYKQPVTRGRISAIRGVNCDGVLRTLVSRGLVEECGAEPDSGAFLYRTTTLFLEKLGLDSVHDLPPLAPFLPDDVEEFADATTR